MLTPYTDSSPFISSENDWSEEKILDSIRQMKEELRQRVVILAHHYQSDQIISFADETGDSLELAKKVSRYADREYIIFCGVRFMAETAKMLAGPHQKVILPDLEALCSLADMATSNDVESAWETILQFIPPTVIPITYINSSSDLKAFVGRKNGYVCTSSNADKIIRHALQEGERLFFFPDQHLGRNTCYQMGIPLEKMPVYHPHLPSGGLSEKQIKESRVLLWHGYCSVHQGFSVQQVKQVRKKDPDAKILVHPECPFDVVEASDMAGSTSFIINHIDQAALGTRFAVGTEINLVNRLAIKHFPVKTVYSLSPFQCLCTTMYRIRPFWLMKSLEAVREEKEFNHITVPEETARMALKALENMFRQS
ncbi:MAG: quinolinate synthase NadA [Candidatus Aureabacteria bacterium]|nr:quinolinate synthase NadA [Candidatus Auribacterota bacterium]